LRKKIKISLIITTFNREKNIFKILNLLLKQVSVKEELEVIICDSFSKNKLKILSYKELFKKLNIIYLESKVNHQAFKRNLAAKKSSGKNIVFIDDDCFPSNKFLSEHLKKLNLNKKKEIYCGLVKYFKHSHVANLIRYRDSRLVSFNNDSHGNIPVKNFISMNMSLNSEILKTEKLLFDNRFRFYGFEDFEFAFRFSNRFKFILNHGLIYHMDDRNFSEFLEKHYYLGRIGIADIIKINLLSAKHSIFYKLEKNFFINLFINIPYIKYFLKVLHLLIIKIEKHIFFYLPAIYKFGILIAYLRGFSDRYEKNFYKNSRWYR
jgi:glycosyltransferase involved in cell wall biosynthesis